MPSSPTRPSRTITALVSLLAGSALATLPASSAVADEPEPPFDGYVLTWNMSSIVSGLGARPGTYDYLSATALRDPGEPGQELRTSNHGATWTNGRPAGWSSFHGNVSIVKNRALEFPDFMDFAERSTSQDGTRLTRSSSSGLSVKIDRGHGTIGRDPDTADISWRGSFSLVLSSGRTTITFANPRLVLDHGDATLSAEVSGQSTVGRGRRALVAPRRIVVSKTLDMSFDRPGSTPNLQGGRSTYQRTTYHARRDATPQRPPVPGGSDQSWGSYPTPFVDVAQRLGVGELFYATGKNDDAKPPGAFLMWRGTATRLLLDAPTSPYGSTDHVTAGLADGRAGRAVGTFVLRSPGERRKWAGGPPDPGSPALLRLGLDPGRYRVSARLIGYDGFFSSRATTTYVVTKARPSFLPSATRRPTRTRPGSTRLRPIWSDGRGQRPTGRVRTYLQQGTTRVYGRTVDLTSRVPIPTAPRAGRWELHVRYAGDKRFLPTRSSRRPAIFDIA